MAVFVLGVDHLLEKRGLTRKHRKLLDKSQATSA